MSLNVVEQAFGTADLVEKLLPFLDCTSTLRLAQSKISCIVNHLQQHPAVWMKIITRVLPEEINIGVNRVYVNARIDIDYNKGRVQKIGKVKVFYHT